MTQEYLLFSDLPALNSSPDAVRERFTEEYGMKPDGIALNNETYYDAVNPPITQQYGHYCYKILGDIQYSEAVSTSSSTAIVGSHTAVNTSNEEAEISLTVDGQWEESTSWSSSITTGMSFSSEIGLEGIFKMGMSFSVSITAGKSGSSSISKSTSTTVTVKVPPKSQIEIQMLATMKQEVMNFNAPIRVSGDFGANFPSPANGHYFNFMAAVITLPQTSGNISGQITGVSAFDVRTQIGEAQPI
ncbi:hypothetical protein [Dickeya fangzhongdai]|uniref:hypothetical protein n=1 Tax=Dickeya fangzhongdai TaxID=1778540 RepID=UPI000EACC3BA|nr:hypothetical protein [Dickeya fangzhongdai]AYH48080.1 hypothetical protein B6N31_10500 [Dickeya fangzhongdai]MBO8134956.1 hypothetical protein [Dickeya fangzhongdai]UMB78832.1 hypothetical protein FXN80_10700 [Dickeya fangzhongdai]